MKKKKLGVILSVIILICSVFIMKSFIGIRPFKDLTANNIKEVTAKLIPPDIRLILTEDETSELVKILNRVVIYQKDNSYTEYGGQAAIFTISKADGTQIRIDAYNPFIIIDGIGYKTKYEPCQALNNLANNLEARKEGN